MPYSIEKKGRGYFVSDGKRNYSSKPLTKAMAIKQRVAIALSEQRKNPKTPMSAYFK